jgi:uncharacterized repeat protein (TIGR01451 family)
MLAFTATLLLTAAPAAEPPVARLPLTFVANDGQAHPAVRFQAQALGGTVFFTASEVVFALPRAAAAAEPGHARRLSVAGARGAAEVVPLSVVRLRFVDAKERPDIVPAHPRRGVVHFLRGSDPFRWRTRVPTYGAVVYRDLYPGIDLRYEGEGGRLKATYLVAPGSDPSRIRWRYHGVDSARVDGEGDLLLALARPAGKETAPAVVIREDEPVAWQDDADGRRPVAVRYRLDADGSVGFELPAGHDASRPLVLDPTLTYSTFLGGGGEDVGYAVAADATGTYVTGYTLSLDFPTQGPVDPGCGTDGTCDFGYHDVFVARLDPAAAGAGSLLYSTYLGGSDSDYGLRIAADATGAAYVTGIARAGFPTTTNAYQRTHTGAPAADAFLAKLSPDGADLLYSTYLGGSGGEGAFGLALDATNRVYLAGHTTSADFPATAGAYDTSCGTDGSCNGSGDAFLAQLDPAASGMASLLSATYLGGSGDERGYGVARDAAGAVYASGRTASDDFPLAGTPFQAARTGDYDGFLARLDASGAVLAYSTYFGGAGYDDFYSVALGPSSLASVAGLTFSLDLPTSADAFQPSFGGVNDAVFARFDTSAAGAASRLYATYLGGTDDDQGFGLAVDAAGAAYVAGFARSADFPAAGGAFQPANGGYWDAFLARIDPSLGTGALVYSTLLGGLGTDAAYGVALDTQGGVHVVGQTYSGDFPIAGAFQPGPGGGSDVFLAHIAQAATTADLRVAQSASADPASAGRPLTYTITVTNDGPAAAPGARLGEIVLGSASYLSATPSQGTCSPTTYFMEVQVGCRLGVLASGASAAVTFVVTPTADGVLTSTAHVSSNVSDPDAADNQAVATTTAVDSVFADGFETGDTSRWSVTSGGAGLDVSGAAALGGTTRGLRAQFNGAASLFVEDLTPDDEGQYRARFYLDPNGFDPGTAQGHLRTRVLLALENGPTRRQVAIVLRKRDGQYAVLARVREDGGSVADTPFVDVTDAPHFIELQWVRSSGPGMSDGYFQMWIDDVFAAALFGLDTDAHGIDSARLGALSVKGGASGTIYFDEFASRRLAGIGP